MDELNHDIPSADQTTADLPSANPEPAVPKRKRRLGGGAVIILLLVAMALYAIYDMGYRGLPIASTCEEFEAFAQKNFSNHDLVERTSEQLTYQITKKEEDFGGGLAYMYAFMNGANFSMDFGNSGKLVVPITSHQLAYYNWSRKDHFELWQEYGDVYVNSKDQAILINNSSFFSSLKIFPSGVSGHSTESLYAEWEQMQAPNFDVCNGINKFSTLQKILKTVGQYPYIVEFYESGYKTRAGSFVVLTYLICQNTEFQNGYMEFVVDTTHNSLYSIEIIRYS